MSGHPDLCGSAVAQYLAALRDEFSTKPNESGYSIMTPFMRPDGDYVEVIAEPRPGGRVALSDMGETFAYLYLSGLALSRRLQDDAKRIGNRYGVAVDVNELVMQADGAHLGDALHNLVQAVLGVSALIEKRRPYVNLRFEEEVEAAIIGQGQRYDPDYEVNGVKEPHFVKFHVNSGKNLLIQPFSQASEIQARRVAERWYYYFDDIMRRDRRWSCVAILDDRGERQAVWSQHSMTPLQGTATLIPWSDKSRFVGMLDG